MNSEEFDLNAHYRKMTKKELIDIINTASGNYQSEFAYRKEQHDKVVKSLTEELTNKRANQIGQILQSMASMMECATKVTLLLK